MSDGTERAIEILLVEDNAGDVRLTKEALLEAKVLTRLHIINDGVAAVEFLKKEGRYGESPQPDLVLLDLNLPKMSGFEVLAKMKQDATLRAIPVIILTSSNAETDIRKCYETHANAYITKPVDIEKYFSLVKHLDEFWFSTVRLPSRS